MTLCRAGWCPESSWAPGVGCAVTNSHGQGGPPFAGSAPGLAIAAHDLSPSEVLAAHIARIEPLNPLLNAIVLPRLDEAIDEARAAERALADGAPVGPLHGVPFTVKESIPVAGMACTAGSALFAGVVPERDAPPVEDLLRAGAILLGKTNVSEVLAHPDSVNPRYGGDPQPPRPRAHCGRLIGRRGGRHRRRDVAAGPGLGPRRLDPLACTRLRDRGPAAQPRGGALR